MIGHFIYLFDGRSNDFVRSKPALILIHTNSIHIFRFSQRLKNSLIGIARQSKNNVGLGKQVFCHDSCFVYIFERTV